MNTKKRLNCYVFGNLIVSFLTLNLITNPTSRVLVQKSSNTVLNRIYEKEIITIDTPDTIISSEEEIPLITISNNVSNNKTYNYVKPSYNSVTGENLVNYAMNYLGLRYVSAGNSLETGTDCSGFTSLIYKEFGFSLGRTVSSQLYSGTYVSYEDLQPGDLVFYSYGSVPSHVAIYIGNGLIIHESNPRDGVKISSVNIMHYITARRLITDSISVSLNENLNISNDLIQNTSIPEEKVEEKSIEVLDEITEEQEIINQTEEQIIEEEKDNSQEVNQIIEEQNTIIDETLNEEIIEKTE